MKTRQGFVSNSSSTSFIVAFKKDVNKCDHCGRSDPDFLRILKEMLDKNWSEDSIIENIGIESVLFALEHPDFSEPRKDIIDAVKEYSNKPDWTVAQFSISYHDDFLNDLLSGIEKSGNGVVLLREG